MIIARAALSDDILRLTIEAKLAIGKRARDRAALAVARVARTLGVRYSLAVLVVLAIVLTAALILRTAHANPADRSAARLHLALAQHAREARWPTFAHLARVVGRDRIAIAVHNVVDRASCVVIESFD